jgi:hypothetical protein
MDRSHTSRIALGLTFNLAFSRSSEVTNNRFASFPSSDSAAFCIITHGAREIMDQFESEDDNKTHANRREPISLGDAQLDNFSELYCFLYVDIL